MAKLSQIMETKLSTLIQLLLEEEFKTKTGNKITFNVSEDSEKDMKYISTNLPISPSAWIVHKIDALVDNKPVGHLNISYIPKERFDEQYASIFDFISGEGQAWAKDFYNMPQEDRLKEMSKGLGGWPGLSKEEIGKLSSDEKDKLEKKYTKIAYVKYKKRFDDFKEFHVDKPLVDYIRVPDDMRRNRIGVALYEFGARWLAKKGFKLHASGIQSNEAKASWEWLSKNKGANIGTEKSLYGGKEKSRTFLSY